MSEHSNLPSFRKSAIDVKQIEIKQEENKNGFITVWEIKQRDLQQKQTALKEQYYLFVFFLLNNKNLFCFNPDNTKTEEYVSAGQIKESIKQLKELLNNAEKRKPYIEMLIKSEVLSEISKQKIDSELFELFNLIVKAKDEVLVGMSEKVENLEQELEQHKLFVNKVKNNQEIARKAQINKANDFAMSLKSHLLDIEKNYKIGTGKKPSLEKIANILNEKQIATPNKEGTWYPSTVKLMKQRIQNLEQNFKVNQLE